MDKSFLSAICEIRRYMYGGLSNSQIKEYLSGRRTRLYFKGIMSFYPLVNDEKQLLELDGWLLSIIHRSLNLRRKLLKLKGFNRDHQFPFNNSKEELLLNCSTTLIGSKKLLEIPSFLLIYRALRKELINIGIERIMNPKSLNYDY